MRLFQIIILLIPFYVFGQNAADILEFKARIGFTEQEERIIGQKIFDDGRKIILIGKKTIQIWDIKDAKLIESRPHEIPNLENIDTSVKISPDNEKIIVLDSISWRFIRKEKKVTASIYNLQTGKLEKILERPTESIRDAEWSRDGKMLVTYSGIFNDKQTEICFWNGEDFEFRFSILAKGTVGFSHLSKDGRKFLLSAENTKKFYAIYNNERSTVIWDTQKGNVKQSLTFGGGENPFVYSFYNSLSPDENFLAASLKEKIAVWQIGGSNLPKYEIPAVKNWQWIKGFSDDSRYLIVYQNKTLEFYDAETGSLEISIPNVKKYEDVKLLADGKTLILQNCDRADFFNLQSKQKIFEIKLVCKSDFDFVSTSYRDFDILRFHPNRPLLLTYSDKTVRVWSKENGNLLQTLVDPNRAEKKKKYNNKDDGLAWDAGWVLNSDYLYATGADSKSILLWKLKN